MIGSSVFRSGWGVFLVIGDLTNSVQVKVIENKIVAGGVYRVTDKHFVTKYRNE